MDNNENEVVSQKPQTEGNPKPLNVEVIRIALEFVAKCFYPGIAIALIVIFLPKLEQIDMKALFGRLQSAKVGDSEFTFSQAQDVGAETAPLNSKIADLERVIGTLKSDLGALQGNVGAVKARPVDKKERDAVEHQYQANAKYTVLVFHRRESRKAGESVTNALLKAGFVSSDTETDFSELQKIQPTNGVIYITYNTAGAQVLSDIKKRIEQLGLPAEVRTNPRAIDLRRGDLQVLVF